MRHMWLRAIFVYGLLLLAVMYFVVGETELGLVVLFSDAVIASI